MSQDNTQYGQPSKLPDEVVAAIEKEAEKAYGLPQFTSFPLERNNLIDVLTKGAQIALQSTPAKEMKEALEEAVVYLNQTTYEKGKPVKRNNIGADSILHRMMESALQSSHLHDKK